MALEDLLERIAVALEKSAALQEEHLNFVIRTQTGVINQTITHDLAERKAHMLRQAEEIMAAEKEKPKYDFNKDIRAPFVALLNKTKDKHGAKDATRLGRKMLMEFTGQDVEVLSVKNLPEAKYEEFLAEVKKQRSYVLNDEEYAGFDKE